MTNREFDDDTPDEGGGLKTEDAKPKLKPPPHYKVVLINDDYTPMEFVVEVLEIVFHLGREKSTQIMLSVHTRGKGICGVFPREIAETRVAQVTQYAQEHEHPLKCEMEAE